MNLFAKNNDKISDSCRMLSSKARATSLSGTVHSQPPIIANGVLLRTNEIDTVKIEETSIVKCPKSFTTQNFETFTPLSIKQKRSITGPVTYLINGYQTTDSTPKISVKAIKHIDILYATDTLHMQSRNTAISLYTLTRKERKPVRNIYHWSY